MQGTALMLSKIFWQIAYSWSLFSLLEFTTLSFEAHVGASLRGNGNRSDGVEWLKCLGLIPIGVALISAIL